MSQEKYDAFQAFNEAAEAVNATLILMSIAQEVWQNDNTHENKAIWQEMHGVWLSKTDIREKLYVIYLKTP